MLFKILTIIFTFANINAMEIIDFNDPPYPIKLDLFLEDIAAYNPNKDNFNDSFLPDLAKIIHFEMKKYAPQVLNHPLNLPIDKFDEYQFENFCNLFTNIALSDTSHPLLAKAYPMITIPRQVNDINLYKIYKFFKDQINMQNITNSIDLIHYTLQLTIRHLLARYFYANNQVINAFYMCLYPCNFTHSPFLLYIKGDACTFGNLYKLWDDRNFPITPFDYNLPPINIKSFCDNAYDVQFITYKQVELLIKISSTYNYSIILTRSKNNDLIEVDDESYKKLIDFPRINKSSIVTTNYELIIPENDISHVLIPKLTEYIQRTTMSHTPLLKKSTSNHCYCAIT